MGTGQRIADRFEIIRQIGEGAFACVYRARDTTMGRDVAIKVLKEGGRSDPEILERFRREAFTVSSLDSPHVVALYDFGTSGDDVFIAMEYVEGPTLRDLMSAPWSAEATHLVIGQIAQAVDVAHRRNVVHRDLKPENVVLVKSASARGRQVKVLDFGLAKAIDLERKLDLAPLTQAGMCFGTPQYMAPEQMQGRPAAPATDLWALAVIAYEMIAGRTPWDGPTPREVFFAVLGTSVPPITKMHSSVTRIFELNRFFARALSHKAGERPIDAGSFFREFAQALLGGVVPKAIFSGIVSAELSVPDEDEPTLPGGNLTTPHHSSGRRFQSSWMMSAPNMPIVDVSKTVPDQRPRTLEDFDAATHPGAASNAAPTVDAAASDELDETRQHRPRSETSLIHAPRARMPALILIALMLAMMVIVGAAGYWLGAHRR